MASPPSSSAAGRASSTSASSRRPWRRRSRSAGTSRRSRSRGQLATAAGAARKLRVVYQSRWRLLLYPGLCAVCGRITNWRSPKEVDEVIGGRVAVMDAADYEHRGGHLLWID